MRKITIGTIIIATCVSLLGCSPTNRVKQEIPEEKYEEVGYATKSEIEDDGTIKITYALVGMKDEKIEYLYLDQIEQNPLEDRTLFTNKEQQNAYGLSYKSDHGEWNEQVGALEKYISGNHMTIEEVNEIPTYEKDEKHPKVAKKGSDLEAGCELDLSDFMEVINKASENTTQVKAMRLGVGEDIRINNIEGRLDVTFSFIATDYRYKICYSKLDVYSIDVLGQRNVLSLREQVSEKPELKQWEENVDAYEEYIYGLNMVEAYGVETYDPGNGIETALPKPGTDLATMCNIDLEKFIITLEEASGRLK